MEAGSKDRPPMLAPGWIDKEIPISKGSPITRSERFQEMYKNVSQEIRDQLNAKAEAVQIILTGIDNDIYSTVDACPNACEMWKVIERLKQDGESLESYYSRFYKMMNELIRNQCKVTNHQVNVHFLLQLQPEWQRFVTLVKQNQELKTVSYNKLYDILKQHQHEINEIRAKRIECVANPLALVAQQQPVYHPQTHPTHYTQNSSTRSQQAATRNRGKAMVNSPQPIYNQEPSMVAEDDEMSKDKEINKLMALISLSFKKIYKPTNKNLRTSSNTSRANHDNFLKINRSAGYERIGNVAGARETVEVSPNAADSGLIFDDEPLQKVSNDDHYNVSAIESAHPEQSKPVHDTYPIEQDAQNVIIDSLDMNYEREEIDQNDDDNDLAKECCYNDNLALMLSPDSDEVIRLEKESRSKLSDLISPFDYNKLNNLYDLFIPQHEKSSEQRYFSERSRLSHTNVNNGKSKESYNKQTTLLDKRMDESISLDKKCQSSIEIFKVKTYVNTIITGVELCKEKIANRTYSGYIDPFIQNTIEAKFSTVISRINAGLEQFNREYYYADHMNAILGVYTELDEVTNLQCDYLELLKKCECLEIELSKNTKFGKSSVIRQPNAFKSQRPSVLGKPTTFSNSFVSKDFSKSKSVTQNNVSNDFSKPVTTQTLPPNKKSILKNTNLLAPRMYKLHTEPNQARTSQLPQDSRKTNKRVSFSTGVFLTTSVSRPQLKSNPIGDRVMCNSSQGKKQEVEDQCRSVKLSKNKTSVTACNDNLNAKTLNVNSVCATCDTCVLIDKHDMCVLNSVAKPIKKIVASKSNQKPRNFTRKLYERLVKIVLFIVDSGCSKHITGNLKLLINFVEKFLGTVKFGYDQIAPILGYEDLVQGAVMIKRVYYIEGLNHNLFSVGQFCDADLEVAFRKSTCYIRNFKGNDLLTGSHGTKLYLVTLQDTNYPNPICLMAKATSSQAWLWHRRLSHLNFDTINLLSKNDIMVGLPKLKFVK
nr:integrase, catalytic region, zinc finger, CCHC-type, peptidase aspartic, catalytic [Tanacetum cinerariifolium]